jgi:hypothetical protein
MILHETSLVFRKFKIAQGFMVSTIDEYIKRGKRVAARAGLYNDVDAADFASSALSIADWRYDPIKCDNVVKYRNMLDRFVLGKLRRLICKSKKIDTINFSMNLEVQDRADDLGQFDNKDMIQALIFNSGLSVEEQNCVKALYLNNMNYKEAAKELKYHVKKVGRIAQGAFTKIREKYANL